MERGEQLHLSTLLLSSINVAVRFLGPLFFILYVNDVQNAVNGANLQLYADDTVIHTSGATPEEATRMLQPSLEQFTKWCTSNKLSLNDAKTKLMVFGTRHKVKKAKEVVIKVANVPLQIVPTYKYLGITLDSTLSFNYHVRSVSNIVSYKINLLAKIRKFLKERVSLQVYKSMILPYFDYGDVIYNSASKEGLDKLQRLQNRGLKICKSLNIRYDTDTLHRITEMPKLVARRKAHVNNFMYNRLKRYHWLIIAILEQGRMTILHWPESFVGVNIKSKIKLLKKCNHRLLK